MDGRSKLNYRAKRASHNKALGDELSIVVGMLTLYTG